MTMSMEEWNSLQKRLQEQIIKNEKLLSKIEEDRAKILKKRPLSKESIKSCICCDYWKVQEKEKHLLIGDCIKKGGIKTDYGFICDDWKKINRSQIP